MEQHYWWIFALTQPIGFAAMTLINQHYKFAGTSVAMMRSAFVVLCLIPFLPYIEIPHSSTFYIATLIAAVLAFIADSLVLNSSANFGAGATSRLLPISPLIGFVIWSIMNPEIFDKFQQHPLIATGLILSLLGSVITIASLRKCEFSKKAFIYLCPVIVVYGCNDIMNKLAQDNSGLISGIIWYSFILSCSSVVIGAIWTARKKNLKETLQNKTMYKVGFAVGLLYIFAMLGRNASMAYTPNPAYTSIIAGATPLLIFVYHRYYNIEDNASVKSGLLFGAFVFTMIYLATLLQ